MMKQGTSLGRSLIKDHKKKRTYRKTEFRHTTDLHDGLDFARLNLCSVTEQNSIDDFLGQVELAQNEYSNELCNVKIANPEENVLTPETKQLVTNIQELYKHVLSVPRRPDWSESTTKEELDTMERNEFLNWRRKLAKLNEEQYINLTPYEKNLEVWRQLWRVVERSDVVIQILDARNPLLFRCKDLETYVKEVGSKQNVLLLNKSDFLTEEQRNYWTQYFTKIGVRIVFFSALWQNQKLLEISEKQEENNVDDSLSLSSQDIDSESEEKLSSDSLNTFDKPSESLNQQNISEKGTSSNLYEKINDVIVSENKEPSFNSAKILNREELILFFKQLKKTRGNDYVTIGLVGYPNVGKSSTINALIQNKKVQVSSTPGKTKHFQTLMVDSNLCLCDCPGLVFPNFVSSKAEMIINGILPIDHLTDHMAPVQLIVNLIPKYALEAAYSIIILHHSEKSENTTAEEFLDAYGYMRGFMTQRGIPDYSRAARYILKDFVNGKILYCYAPPDVNEIDYQKNSIRPSKKVTSVIHPKVLKLSKNCDEEMDKVFFQKATSQAHVKGHKSISITSAQESGKPWKKHHNKNKKEKLRRVYNVHDN